MVIVYGINNKSMLYCYHQMMILTYNNFKWLDGDLSVTPGETTTCKSLIRYDDDDDVDENGS